MINSNRVITLELYIIIYIYIYIDIWQVHDLIDRAEVD